MFFNKLFKKSDVLLKAKISISESNASFDIIDKSPEIKDRELILMGLLVYARVLRTESSKKEREKLTSTFIEFQTNYKDTEYSQDYRDTMLSILKIISKSSHSEDSTNIKLKKANGIYIDMGVMTIYPLASVVYTIFRSLWEAVDAKN